MCTLIVCLLPCAGRAESVLCSWEAGSPLTLRPSLVFILHVSSAQNYDIPQHCQTLELLAVLLGVLFKLLCGKPVFTLERSAGEEKKE